MIFDKKKVFRNVLESSDGIHLSLYIHHQGDSVLFSKMLKQYLSKVHDYVEPVLSKSELKDFIEPINKLLNDHRQVLSAQHSIALFRNQNFFRIVSIPMQVRNQFSVANSFHVKPLLKWIQNDKEFIFVGLNKDKAELYLGNQSYCHLIDKLSGPFSNKENRLSKQRRLGFADWLNMWVKQLNLTTELDVYYAVENELHQNYFKMVLDNNEFNYYRVSDQFNEDSKLNDIQFIRETMQLENKIQLDETLAEIKRAEKYHLVKKNIFMITKFAIQGKIRKLVIADEVQIFGKIDTQTGGLALHPFDMDHEDDDILDDLAQIVLQNGGEVIVASKQSIPDQKPVIAILHNQYGKQMNSYGMAHKEKSEERISS